MSTIRLADVTKRFTEMTAVNRVSLAVAAGEVLCLLGPSGCGKTTTLRMVAGLEAASAGDIYLGEARVNGLTARQRNVAMAFQFYALYPSLSVADNLAYPLHAEGLSRASIGERVAHIAATLELEAVLERLPAELAEGEKQRVAVGRAIIREPSCFLFDEPLSRLDVELRQEMRGQIKRVLAGLSKATVIVTHDQLEALTMADRIAVMRDGNIEQVTTPHLIFAEPDNLFVAGFIGTPQMNLLPAGLVERGAGTATFRIGEQRIAVPVHDSVALDERMTVGIRPRAFALREGAGEPAGTRTTLTATADLLEPMGAETLVHALAGDTELRVVLRRNRRVRLGDRLALAIDMGEVHLFAADGQRVRRTETAA